MPVVLKNTHLDHGGMTQTAKQSCEVQELCKEGKQYPNNGILKVKNLPEPPILCFLGPFIIEENSKCIAHICLTTQLLLADGN